MSISGSVPAHSYSGIPVYGNRPAGQQAGSRIASGSGPYVGDDRGNKCTANSDTCKGNRVKGQMLCAGHLRSEAKKQAEAKEREAALQSLGEEVADGA